MSSKVRSFIGWFLIAECSWLLQFAAVLSHFLQCGHFLDSSRVVLWWSCLIVDVTVS